jgi:hypothetical protein
MESKTYYLGVDSIGSGVDAVGKLTFFTVFNRKNAQITCSHDDRMKVGILPVHNPEGAVVFITGSFAPKEMTEIEALAQYEYPPVRGEVSKVAAQTAIDLQKKGLSIPSHILGKPE